MAKNELAELLSIDGREVRITNPDKLYFSREIERRAPSLATSRWRKEERHGVFLDYNQNAKDRTTCSAYLIRPPWPPHFRKMKGEPSRVAPSRA